MKKLKLLFTALLLLCCIGIVNAEEATINGIKYEVITKAKQATVISGGYYTGNIVIPSEITYNNEIYNVTRIGEYAFSHYSELTSITIPKSITSIGFGAFDTCYELKEVHISDIAAWCSISFKDGTANPLQEAKNLYLNGKFVKDIVIPEGVTEIKEYAFYGYSKLTSFEIPSSVTSIGSRAFSGCTELISIEIPNGVTSIGSFAFEDCSGLTSIEIPNSVTSIGDGAFFGCSGLKSITIPNCITSIANSAFEGCSGLTSITIPNSVTSIGSYAFNCCTELTSITIGNSIASIGDGSFYSCKNLTDVFCLATSVPSTNTGAFNESYPEDMTLHVPAEAINSYKTTVPWSRFGNIVALDAESVVTPKCENPVIKYSNGELVIECDTENAEIVTKITSNDINSFYGSIVELSATYNISVYATASGYENSDIVNATLCWVECDCNADDNTGIIDIPAKALLVTSNNGTINITCSLEGESVELYTSDAMFIESTTIENGCATIESGLSKGDIAIVKIGEKSIKVIID